MVPQQSPYPPQSRSWKTAGILLLVSLFLPAPALLSQASTPGQPDNPPADDNSPGVDNPAPPTPVVRDSRSIKQLTAALKSSDRTVRGTAVEALGESKDPRAVKPLIAALKDSDPYVRAFADTALINIGPPAVEALIGTLKDSDPYIPALSAMALSTIKDARAHQALMTALTEHNTKVILGIHTYFVKLGVPGSEPALIEALNKFPSRRMALEFLNSGNPVLAGAANQWATKYHQQLDQSTSATPVRWGSAQDTPSQPDTNPTPAPQ
ncbi:MAG: HEAT repeat domain-containing protein [Terracidiphilus sp.]